MQVIAAAHRAMLVLKAAGGTDKTVCKATQSVSLRITEVAPIVKRAPSSMTRVSRSPRISLSTKVPVLLGPSRNTYFKRPFLSRLTFRMQWVMSTLGSLVSMGQLMPEPFM